MDGPAGAAVRLGVTGVVIGGVVGGGRAASEYDRTLELMAVGPEPKTPEEAAIITSLQSELREQMGGKATNVAKGAAAGAVMVGAFCAAAGALISFVGGRLAGGARSGSMADVEDVQLKLAQIAEKALWRTMGRPGDVPWWFRGVEIAQDRDGNYFLRALIHNGLPMDDTGWPYGLPHKSEGVKVVAQREDPNSPLPVKLGPTN